MDLSGVSFMDSSGIAVVLRAHRRMAALGGSLIVTGVPAQARKVFDAAGVPRLVTMQ
jgi:stage II sporulation protein AA (anti-sigma F factor antagonist)